MNCNFFIQSSIKPCLIVHLVAKWTLIYLKLCSFTQIILSWQDTYLEALERELIRINVPVENLPSIKCCNIVSSFQSQLENYI